MVGVRLYLDSSVIRRSVDGTSSERAAAVAWIKKAAESPAGTILLSKLVRAECLVMPYRNRDSELVERFESVFRDNGIVLVSISDEILDLATRIFAEHGIKMADAIHTATAVHGQCDALIARDEPWTKKSPILGLRLIAFSDLAAADGL